MQTIKLRNLFSRLKADRSGAAITEYLIIVALVAVLCIAAYRQFGNAIDTKVRQQISKVQGL
jgi:Flp pilus assembly pilin Flp